MDRNILGHLQHQPKKDDVLYVAVLQDGQLLAHCITWGMNVYSCRAQFWGVSASRDTVISGLSQVRGIIQQMQI